MLSAVTRPQATQEDQLPGRQRSPTSDGGACARRDNTPVEVALSLRRSTRRVRCGTRRQRAWWTSPQSGCIAWSGVPEVSPGAPPGSRVARCSARRATWWWQRPAVLDRSTGTLDLRVPIEQDRPENRANDSKVDSREGVRGRHHGLRQAAGERVVVPRRRRLCDPMLDGLTIPNGPGRSMSRGGRLYLADTPLCVVDVFDLTPRAPSAVAGGSSISAEQLWPDWQTVDGGHVVALGRAGAVHRYRADGTPASSSCRHRIPPRWRSAGADGGDLYITTSWVDPSGAPTSRWRARSSVAAPGYRLALKQRTATTSRESRHPADRAHGPLRSFR